MSEKQCPECKGTGLMPGTENYMFRPVECLTCDGWGVIDRATGAVDALRYAIEALKHRHVTEQTLRMDDRPDAGSNQGICAGGLSHLEKNGFKDGDRVRVITIIEKIG